MTPAALILLLAWAFGGVVIDRIVVTVNRGIVTESDVRRHLRAAAALNGEPPELGESARHEAIERLIDLALIRRELEVSRYPEPTPEEAKAWATLVYKDRLSGPDALAGVLKLGGLTEKELVGELRNQLITLRFIESRFRPGIAVTDADVESYYKSKFLAEWKADSGEAPPLDEVREVIERILTDQRIDQALQRWIEDARKQARIVVASQVRSPEKRP